MPNLGTVLIFRGPIITPYRRVNDVLLFLREFWSRRRQKRPVAPTLGRRRDVQVTVLTSDISAVQPAQLSGIAYGDLEVLGFRFAGAGAVPQLPGEVTELDGCAFPGFHDALVSALTRISGARILALTPDLPGLGLGLLHNYHFGTPLVLSAGDAGGGSDADWSNPDFLDPAGEAWRRYLAAFVDQVPREAGASVGILPAARRFAQGFSGFYQETRSRR
jgi:hypothetical protein